MIIPAIPCKFKGVEYMFIPNGVVADKEVRLHAPHGGLLCSTEQLLRFEINQVKGESYYAFLSESGQIRRNGNVIGHKSELVFVDESEVLEFLSAGEVSTKVGGGV